jgi:hypothetical protein
MLFDSIGNPRQQLFRTIGEAVRKLIFKVADRSKETVARHSHAVGVFVFGSDMNIVTEMFFQ